MASFQQFQHKLLQQILRLAPIPEGHALPEGLWFSRPPKREMGDLALPVFAVAKAAKQPPPAVAAHWAEAVQRKLAEPGGELANLDVPVTSAAAQGPYLNLTLDNRSLARFVISSVIGAGADYGRVDNPSPETVMVEYSSPNSNKPLHLGHIRNNLIGMALSNLYEAAGNKVVRVNLVNDRGIHICKSMLAYQKWGRGETPASTGEKGDHFVGRYYVLFDQHLKEERTRFAAERGVDLSRFSKESLRALSDREEVKRREEEADKFEEAFQAASALMREARETLRRWESDDPETKALWRTLNDWVYEGFRQTYARLGSRFDRWYFESETWQLGKKEVERGLALGVFYRKEDGSVWAHLEPMGAQDKLLLRSDGTSVYITQDLGTAIQKFEDFHMDRSIYVVGSEQVDHFRNLFALLRLLGHLWADRCHHASYGLVTLPRGMGRLKSREGIAVDADDLLDELKEIARQKIVEGGYCETKESIESTAETIGQGALKLYILQVGSEKSIQFDPNETIAFTGDTGPAVQYSHARIQGILRKGLALGKVEERDLTPGKANGSGPFLHPEDTDLGLLVEREEQDVIRLLADYPDSLSLAVRQLSAAPVASHLLELTKAYARMYHEHEVLQAESRELLRARLQLSLCVGQVLRNGLAALTIEAPDRM